MMDLVQTAGAGGYAVLSFVLLALLMTPLWAVLAAFRKRVPSPLVYGLLFLTAWVGYLATAWAVYRTSTAVSNVDAEVQRVLASAGWSEALSPLILAWAGVAFVGLTTAWLCAFGHAVAVGPRPSWSFGRAAGSTLLPGFLALILLTHAAIGQGLGPLLASPSLLLFGAPALGLACLRLQDEYGDDASRLVAARLKVGAGLVAAVLGAAVAVNLQAEAQVYSAVASASPDQQAALVAAAQAVRSGSWMQGFVGGGFIGLVAVAAGLSRVAYLDSRRSAVSGMFMAAGILFTLVLHIAVTLYARGVLEPLGALIE
jgi:hypothetical protein